MTTRPGLLIDTDATSLSLRSRMTDSAVFVTTRLPPPVMPPFWVTSPPAEIVIAFPALLMMPVNARLSSSFSVIDEPSVAAVADTDEAARWTLMLVPAVRMTAEPVTSGVASPGVTSRIDWPAERVTVFVDADS